MPVVVEQLLAFDVRLDARALLGDGVCRESYHTGKACEARSDLRIEVARNALPRSTQHHCT